METTPTKTGAKKKTKSKPTTQRSKAEVGKSKKNKSRLGDDSAININVENKVPSPTTLVEPNYHPPTIIDPNDPIQHAKAITFCTELTQEFWKEAEDIFMNRFLHHNKDWRMASELRDTWLRINECLYMEFNKPISLSTSVDTPPLPLTSDPWARGGLEEWPEKRRESLLDPFIRRKRLGELITTGGRSASVKSISSIPNWQLELFQTEEEEEEKALIEHQNNAEDEGLGDIVGEIEKETEIVEDEETLEEIIQIPEESPSKLLMGEEKLVVLKKVASGSLVTTTSSHSGLEPWTKSETKIGMEGAFKLFGQTTTEAIQQRSEEASKAKVSKKMKKVTHKSQSESESDLNITTDDRSVETLSLDDTGTESLYENAAVNKNPNSSPPESNVPSQSDIVAGKVAVIPDEDKNNTLDSLLAEEENHDSPHFADDKLNDSVENEPDDSDKPVQNTEAILDFAKITEDTS